MTSRVAQGPPPPAAAKTGVEVPKDEKKVQVAPVNRREFLFYVWGASMAMLLGQSGGILIWFMLPRFRAGEFGGVFSGTSKEIPEKGTAPANFAAGKFWLSNTQTGIVALYKVCVHLGCLYAWVPNNTRFECPCHGSKYELDGLYIEGPAPRSLDRFNMRVVTNGGQELLSNEVGDPIPVEASEVAQWFVDTGDKLQRPGRV
jgi:cytochrome b6-f complex iron-sulfur subunit